jgi:hypothetical protein
MQAAASGLLQAGVQPLCLPTAQDITLDPIVFCAWQGISFFLCWTLAVKDSRMLGIHDATTPSPQGHVHAIMQKKTLLTLFGVFLFIFSQAAHAAIVQTRVVPLPGVHVTQTARRNAPNTNSVWRVEPQLRRRWSTSKQVTADSHSPFLSGGTVC